MMGRLLVLAALVALLPACAAFGTGLDAQATAANLDNVNALVAESNSYTSADATIPASLRATREARNREAVRLAQNMAGTR